jgi:hypothetical protein
VKKQLLSVMVIAALGALATGCGPDFERIDFANRTTPPVTTVIAYEGIEFKVGIAVATIATAVADGEDMDEETVIGLEPVNSDVIGVDPTIEANSFVIYGVGPGTTTINVEIDGELEGEIPVTVTLQQPEP